MAGWICLANFLRAIKCGVSCRIVTTSVAEHHLKVLWAEIARFIRECRVPLLAKDGGPLVINHLEIRRKDEMAMKNPGSYLVGRVSKAGEGLAGHHAEYTLGVADEASGCSPVAYEMFQGWAKRMLVFGNPNPTPPTHFFRKGCEAGDMLAAGGKT